MKTHTAVLGVAATLLLGGIAYHIAVPDASPRATRPSKTGPAPGTTSPSSQDTLTAEARAIWEATVTFPTKAAYEKALREAVFEKDPDRKFALLHAMGVRISRAAFDREISDKPGKWSDPSKWQMSSHLRAEDMFGGFTGEWMKESPREALAWRYRLPGPNSVEWMEGMLRIAARAAASAGVTPAQWETFAGIFPDPGITRHAMFWATAEDGSEGFWNRALAAGVEPGCLNSMAREKIGEAPPEEALRFLSQCPDPAERRRHLLLLSSKLTPGRMLELSEGAFAEDAKAVAALRALAGEAGASFEEAATVFRDARMDAFTEALGSRWLERDPAAALRHAADSRTLDTLMPEAMRKGIVDEDFIERAFADGPAEEKDKFLTALYQSMAGGNPADALARILASERIGDQVRSARTVLERWSFEHPQDAAAWYRRLPADADRRDLASTILSGWMASEPDSALAFAAETGTGLSGQDLMTGIAAYGNAATLEEATAFLRRFRGDEYHDAALARLAMEKFAGQPEAGIRYVREEAAGDGDQAALDMLSSMALFADDPAECARLALTLDLGSLEPGFVGNQGHLIIADIVRHRRVAEAYDWTLHLPSAAAESAREWASRNPDLRKPENLAVYQDWLRRAPLKNTEREKLLRAVTD